MLKRIFLILQLTSLLACIHLQRGNGVEEPRALRRFLQEYAASQSTALKITGSYDSQLLPTGTSPRWSEVSTQYAEASKYGYTCTFEVNKAAFSVRCDSKLYFIFGGLSIFVDQAGLVRYSNKGPADANSNALKDF